MTPSNASPFLSVPRSEWIASNDLAFAIFDRYPVTPGHALVVPRRVVATWWEASANEQRAIFELVSVVRTRLELERGAKGFNVGFNAGEAAGQTIPHLHVHVIPRYDGDVPDPRGGIRWIIPSKANYIAGSGPSSVGSALLPGGDDRLLRRLQALFDDVRFDRIDLVVSFILNSGVRELERSFESAHGRGASIRVLTTDYLGVTEPAALNRLLDWSGDDPDRMQVRVFESGTKSFHPKSYVFWSSREGTAQGIVGSSNMSRSALAEGIEWNLIIGSVADLVREFETLWRNPRAIPLTRDWLDRYRPRSQKEIAAREFPVLCEAIEEPQPTQVQQEALEALAQARQDGARAALVVMATGLGKTYLSAFDSRGFERVLFVAHRDEILQQSRDVFRRIRPESNFGMFHADEKTVTADVTFASVQTLARRCEEFAPDAFDYVVFDEFHHAAAASYRRVVDHFRPRFLLGLTATPDRMDGQLLLPLCGDRFAFRCDLVEGISRKLLCPFEYFGVKDSVDFTPIPWRNGKFDPEALTRAVETRERADHALREWRARAGRRTLAFCCTVTHADFMARHFSTAGIRAVAVHSGPTSAPRVQSIERLKTGELDVVFSVDVFNEGLDVPDVDTILMLRPSESPVVFLQQFGRGLRLGQPGKVLHVIDFIGNHRSFFMKPRTLLSLGAASTASVKATLDAMESGEFHLPPGCSVEYELGLVDVFKKLVRLGAHDELEEWCREEFAENGARPSADRAFQVGFDPGAIRRRDRSQGWFDFLKGLGARAQPGQNKPRGEPRSDPPIEPMLSDLEARALDEGGDFLRGLEVESLTKSFKLVSLKALLADGALLTGAPLDQVATTSRALIERDRRVAADVSADGGRDVTELSALEWKRYWRKNPIAAWIGESSGRESPSFRLDGEQFVPQFQVSAECADAFCSMVSEIVEWRLAAYLKSRRPLAAGVIRCKVSHSSGNPMVRIHGPERVELPSGPTPFRANGTAYEGNFQKIALNVARRPGESGNALHALLRGWFGPNAGHPGTSHFVMFEQVDGEWQLRPDAAATSTATEAGILVPFFPNYAVACGAFDQPQPASLANLQRPVTPLGGQPAPEADDFMVFARGDSMVGGIDPIYHGDPLLLRWARGASRRDLLGRIVLVRHGEARDAPTVLKRLQDDGRGGFLLASDNPARSPATLPASAADRIVATFTRKLRQSEINPLASELHRPYRRELIPPLYKTTFNSGNWNSGHVSLDTCTILFVTLDKSEMQRGSEYHDQIELPDLLHWSSQSSTSRDSKRGHELLDCLDTGRDIHLWLRRRKTDVAFTYCGLAVPVSDEGDRPIRITWRMLDPLPTDSELASTRA